MIEAIIILVGVACLLGGFATNHCAIQWFGEGMLSGMIILVALKEMRKKKVSKEKPNVK